MTSSSIYFLPDEKIKLGESAEHVALRYSLYNIKFEISGGSIEIIQEFISKQLFIPVYVGTKLTGPIINTIGCGQMRNTFKPLKGPISKHF